MILIVCKSFIQFLRKKARKFLDNLTFPRHCLRQLNFQREKNNVAIFTNRNFLEMRIISLEDNVNVLALGMSRLFYFSILFAVHF